MRGRVGVFTTVNDEMSVCTVSTKQVSAEDRANARLIAAAPELLEAAKAALPFLCPPPGKQFVIDADTWSHNNRFVSDVAGQLHEAISLAEGRTDAKA